MKVIECVEAFKEQGDDWEFDHFATTLAEGTKIFRAQSARRYALHQDIDIRDLDCPVVLLPPEDLWPPLTDDFTHAPHPIPDNAYAKRPTLFDYYPETSAFKPRELLLHEARICEFLRRHPHKHIASYLGCINDGGFITGLCYVKYKETLSDRLEDSSRPLNPDSCQWEGGSLYGTGTPGWTDGSSWTSSERKNDDFGLKQLSEYLSQETSVRHDCQDM